MDVLDARLTEYDGNLNQLADMLFVLSTEEEKKQCESLLKEIKKSITTTKDEMLASKQEQEWTDAQ